jgi:hypothetical protein
MQGSEVSVLVPQAVTSAKLITGSVRQLRRGLAGIAVDRPQLAARAVSPTTITTSSGFWRAQPAPGGRRARWAGAAPCARWHRHRPRWPATTAVGRRDQVAQFLLVAHQRRAAGTPTAARPPAPPAAAPARPRRTSSARRQGQRASRTRHSSSSGSTAYSSRCSASDGPAARRPRASRCAARCAASTGRGRRRTAACSATRRPWRRSAAPAAAWSTSGGQRRQQQQVQRQHAQHQRQAEAPGRGVGQSRPCSAACRKQAVGPAHQTRRRPAAAGLDAEPGWAGDGRQGRPGGRARAGPGSEGNNRLGPKPAQGKHRPRLEPRPEAGLKPSRHNRRMRCCCWRTMPSWAKACATTCAPKAMSSTGSPSLRDVQAVAGEPYDAWLVDWQLPDGSGLDWLATPAPRRRPHARAGC